MGVSAVAEPPINEAESVMAGTLAREKSITLRTYVNQLLEEARKKQDLWTDDLEKLRTGLANLERDHALYTATDDEAKLWTLGEQTARKELIEQGVAPIYTKFHSRMLEVLQWKHLRWLKSRGF